MDSWIVVLLEIPTSMQWLSKTKTASSSNEGRALLKPRR